jgi:hypothetical protein
VVVTWSSTEGRFLLDGRPLADLEAFELERVALRARESTGSDPGLVVRARVRLEVVTAESLREVARWIGGDPEEEEGSLITEQLLGSLVNDLAREAKAECPVKPLAAGAKP